MLPRCSGLRRFLLSPEPNLKLARWTGQLGVAPKTAVPFSWEKSERIVIIKLDDIGDFILSIPFLRELRKAAPRARIDLVVNPTVTGLAEGCPLVDRVLTFNSPGRGLRGWDLRRHWRAWCFAHARLRKEKYSAVVIPRWGEDAYHATFLALFSGAPWRVGYSETAIPSKAEMNRGYDQLLNPALDPGEPAHEVQKNLELLRRTGARIHSEDLEFWLGSAERDWAKGILFGVANSFPAGLIAMAPGAADPLRRWPVERFAQLAARLAEDQRTLLVLLGTREEAPLTRQISKCVPNACLDLAGKTSLKRAAAVLEKCHLFIGNDTGVKHMAALMNVPVVEISGWPAGANPAHSNSPDRFHAWGVPHRVLRPQAPPDERRRLMVERISVDEAYRAARELSRLSMRLQSMGKTNR